MKNISKILVLFFAFVLIGKISLALAIEEQPKANANDFKVETTSNSVLKIPFNSENSTTIKEKIIVNKFLKNTNEYFKQAQSRQQPVKEQGDPKSQIVALVLVIFLGGLGIHRFYLGYTGIGVLMLLTGGVCGILALIDLIRIIIGDLKPADGSDYDPKF